MFSPDSKVVAVHIGDWIELVDPTDGRKLVRLENPSQQSIGDTIFTPDPDRTKLIGAHNNGKAKGVCVWDLRLIRQQLDEIGLDWDAPPYSPVANGNSPVRPPKITVRLGEPNRPNISNEEKGRQAIEQLRKRVEANGNDARSCNHLAWLYLTAAEPLRDVKAAVTLAENASRLEPTNAVHANTLGVAYYRAGRYREAIDVLRSNLARQEDWGLAFDLYFLAMSHHSLGESSRARDYYDWAVRWTKTQPRLDEAHMEELRDFRAEADRLMAVPIEIAPRPREKN